MRNDAKRRIGGDTQSNGVVRRCRAADRNRLGAAFAMSNAVAAGMPRRTAPYGSRARSSISTT
ncbi:hypothetical protein CFB34_015080 [Burkholderia sp. HI4860]|uniref:hypothetical protein n=1 Tax=Burkholderia sp. HI4860 TaxID=2015361 RepID=UPI001F61315A|nr:hypothetical protein [Burkholderia sp. HI4860]MCI3970354.1 hypothetical protein [Burkholderia sp. HI4860]